VAADHSKYKILQLALAVAESSGSNDATAEAEMYYWKQSRHHDEAAAVYHCPVPLSCHPATAADCNQGC